MTLMVLLGAATAASACPTIDVKPYSCPNPINLKSNGVVTIAANGDQFGPKLPSMCIEVVEVWLEDGCQSYPLDFKSSRATFEDVVIAPCCSNKIVCKDGIPDLLIKLKDLECADQVFLSEGDYKLFIKFKVIYEVDGKECFQEFTGSDCIKLVQV